MLVRRIRSPCQAFGQVSGPPFRELLDYSDVSAQHGLRLLDVGQQVVA